MYLAILAMIIGRLIIGAQVNIIEIIIFPILTLIGVIFTGILYLSSL